MSPAWLFGSQLLPLAQQVWRHDGVGGQAAKGTGDGERPAEKAAGRVDAGERGDAGSVAKKVVSASGRRELVRHMTTQGLSERRSLKVLRMSASH